MGGRVDEPIDGECPAKPEPTIWKIPDDVWEIAVEILDREYPKRVKGHRRVELRPIINGVLYRLRTGCQWNHLPKEFGDDSTIHRHFQAMCERGVFVQLWAALVERCDELDGVDWEWQAVDGSMVKARGKSQMGADAVGKNPTDREKRGEVESAGREDRQPPGHRDRRSERA